MNDLPLVSVIVPNYNHAKYLRQRLDSIYNQTFKDFEVILLDDASTDDSLSILNEYAKRSDTQLVVNDENSGSTFKQWNKGVSLANGKYIWIAESDDWAERSFLEEAVALLQATPRVGLVHSDSWMIDESGKRLERRREFLAKKLNERLPECDSISNGGQEVCDRIIRWNTISNASAVVSRKELYQKVGGADESMCLVGDWLLWIKLLEISDYAYLAKPLNYNRTHSHTVRNKIGFRLSVLAEKVEVLRYVVEHFPVERMVIAEVLHTVAGPDAIRRYQEQLLQTSRIEDLMAVVDPADVVGHMGIRWQLKCLRLHLQKRLSGRV